MRWCYRIMNSVRETMEHLSEYQGKARVVAGGTDLMVQLKETDVHDPNLVLLDVSRVEEMAGVTQSGSVVFVGAAATMGEIASCPLVREKSLALAQGAEWVGSPQIRNVATVGGNVVNAQPAGDTSVPLVALGAVAHILSPEGDREMLVEHLFSGVGKSKINPCRELITHFTIPVCESPFQSSSLERLAKRKAFTLPQLLTAVRVELDESGRRFAGARIVVSPVTTVPWRAERAEKALMGAPATPAEIKHASALAMEDVHPRSSLRAGADYRKAMTEVLVRRALMDTISQLSEVPHG